MEEKKDQDEKIITCCDCNQPFSWTAEQQKFFKDHNITKEPVRCRQCAIILRDKRKQEKEQAEQTKAQEEPAQETSKNTEEKSKKKATKKQD